MSDLLDNLRKFNSKERFFLVGHLLGKQEFLPSPSFRKRISEELELTLPECVFSAMDYHLDWLYASLYIALSAGQNEVFPNHNILIRAQQEDIDYIIAYEENGTFKIILIEAKAKSGWLNTQLRSKAERLIKIFGFDGKYWNNVNPYFILMSPHKPKNIDVSYWPSWMQLDGHPRWMELPIPDDLFKVTRCNKKGTPLQSGTYWKVIRR